MIEKTEKKQQLSTFIDLCTTRRKTHPLLLGHVVTDGEMVWNWYFTFVDLLDGCNRLITIFNGVFFTRMSLEFSVVGIGVCRVVRGIISSEESLETVFSVIICSFCSSVVISSSSSSIVQR